VQQQDHVVARRTEVVNRQVEATVARALLDAVLHAPPKLAPRPPPVDSVRRVGRYLGSGTSPVPTWTPASAVHWKLSMRTVESQEASKVSQMA